MEPTILTICLVFIGLTALLYILFRPKDRSKLLDIISFTGLLFPVLVIVLYLTRDQISTGALRTFLDFHYTEFNHSATFSSSLLFLAGISALGISIFSHSQKIWFRAYFVLLAAMCFFLAADEYYVIHETISQWERIYVPVTVVVALLGMVVFWRARPAHGLIVYFAFFGGLAGAALGGVILEEFRADNCFDLLARPVCMGLPSVEEILEMLGYTLAGIAFIALAQYLLDSKNFARFQRMILLGTLAWAIAIILNFWVQPAIESRFFAQPVEIHFTESTMQVTGFRLNQESFHAGDTLKLELFWQVDESEYSEYGYTINLIHPVTGASVLRENFTIAYPPVTGWFPGVTYRIRTQLLIPEDIETPLSPILSLSIWRRASSGYQNFTVAESSVPIFAEQHPILSYLSFLSANEASLPSPNYRFANAVSLANPELSQLENGNYSLSLDWLAEADIQENLGYIIHFLNEDGENHLIFDRPPFESRFLSLAWTKGMFEHEDVLLEIPESSAGTYQAYIGLLNLASGERLTVTDSSGNILANGLIPLGTVEIPSE